LPCCFYAQNIPKSTQTEVIDCEYSRLCAFTIKTCEGPVLFVNVYMPTDTRDDNSFDEYVDTCMKISFVFATTNAV